MYYEGRLKQHPFPTRHGSEDGHVCLSGSRLFLDINRYVTVSGDALVVDWGNGRRSLVNVRLPVTDPREMNLSEWPCKSLCKSLTVVLNY